MCPLNRGNFINNGILKEAVIGIENIDSIYFADYLLTLSEELGDLAEMNIQTIFLVFIKSNASNVAIRMSTDWLKDIKKSIESADSDIFTPNSFGRPLPVAVTEELLESLEGDVSVKIIEPNLSASSISDLLLTLWKLSESKRWLDSSNSIESEWLAELKDIYRKEIEKQLVVIRDTLDKDKYIKYEKLAGRIVESGDLIENDELREHFNELIMSLTHMMGKS